MPGQVQIFDTTLRDGEQSPGVAFDTSEKLQIARQLASLQVDVIEAGFPIASSGDFEAVQAVAREIGGPVICALARVHKADIDRAWEALKDADRPRIHTFVSTSDIHIRHQMDSTREDVKGLTRAAVSLAKSYCDDVEFSPMDATRADLDYTAEVCAIAISEGATVINIPDTVGYATPEEYAEYLRRLQHLLPEIGPDGDVVLSVHCHDDLGMAVANSYAGLRAGARQAEVSVNGIGERAGNCSLEELVMFLRTRQDAHGLTTQIATREIIKTSRLVSRISGYPVPPNKAIIGANAFAHESGIHQDGVLKERETYEIMDPEEVGLESNSLVLGKHSGRHALQEALSELGYELDGAELNTAFIRMKEIADRKKHITALDLEALMSDHDRVHDEIKLSWFELSDSASSSPTAQVVLTVDGEEKYAEAGGDGAMDALFAAIQQATEMSCKLVSYNVSSVSDGEDALAEVTVVLDTYADGGEAASQRTVGHGVDTDTVRASGHAYVHALNRLAG